MPELPEVETVVRSVRARVVGQKILTAEIFSKRVTRQEFAAAIAGLSGKTIQAVRRHGKQIFFDLDRGILYIHLGMTGKLLWNGERSKYARAILHLSQGTLTFDDIRQFGRFEFYPCLPVSFESTGPDALQVSFEDFYKRLKRHHSHIKPLLLNQSFISGVGNIYADEALFAARIHPRAIANKISKMRAAALHENILAILESAVVNHGSSISNYVDADGKRGTYQTQHNAYGRTGNPCPRCDKTIRRVVLGQRGTHYCPGCQHV